MQAKQEQAQQTQAQQTQATSLVLIESNGTVKTLKAKDVTLDTLYKKCGFRSSEDFVRQHTWEIKLTGEKHIVSAWAKKTGKANFENKYDFPPPIDSALFFGTCAVVRTDEEGNLIGLTKETWEKIYEKLFGGFEDLGEEDEYSTDELEGVEPELITSHGYLKDDFVVSDEEMAPAPAKQTQAKQTPAKQTPAKQTQEKQTQAKQTQAQAKQTQAKQTPAKQTPAQVKQTPAQVKQTQAKQTQAQVKQTQAKQTPAQVKQTSAKQTPVKETAPAKAKKTTDASASKKTAAKKKTKATAPEPVDESETESESELEEEVYTFSDEE